MMIESHLHGGKLEVMGDIPGCLVNPAHGLDQRLRVVLRPWDQIQTAPASCSYQVLKLLPWDQQGIREVVGHWRSDYTGYHGLEDDSRVLVPNLDIQSIYVLVLSGPPYFQYQNEKDLLASPDC